MEEQAAAERQRRAAVTKAEGEKQAAILEADGRLEASRRDAQAQVVLAKASSAAITLVSEAVGDKDLPVLYLLGEKYADALVKLSTSTNAKTVVLPADLPQALRGILNKA
jgi:regulator of protease activity HflC (stomatin/prohibitin superfamily)